MRQKSLLIFMVLLLVAGLAATAYAAETEAPKKHAEKSLLGAIKEGGIPGFLIIVDSICALTTTILLVMALRRNTVSPPELVSQIESHFDDEEYEEALHLCQASPCFLARVVGSGLANVHLGWGHVREAMDAAGEEEFGKINNMLSYLQYMQVMGPMLGLLGTVVGMIGAFNSLAAAGGSADASLLAGSVGQAMVCTALGIFVAIPAQGAYVILRAQLVKVTYEVGAISEELMERFRQAE